MNATSPAPPTVERLHKRRLLACGIVVAPLFLFVAVVQILVRPGFDITQHAVSSLQNGEFGWVQSASFMAAGLLSILCAWGMRHLLRGSRGGTWGPLLVGIFGIGMVLAGLFPPDPAFGFPAGAPEGPPESMSTGGGLHSAGFFVAFIALIAGCFVLARHFGRTSPAWRNGCLAVGIVTLLLIVLGNAAFPGAAGIFYFAAGAISFTWLSTVAWRLSTGESAPSR